MQINTVAQTLVATGTWLGLQVLGAIAMWIVGRWLIRFAIRLISRALTGQHIDATLTRYICSIVSVMLDLILIVAILGFFGQEYT